MNSITCDGQEGLRIVGLNEFPFREGKINKALLRKHERKNSFQGKLNEPFIKRDFEVLSELLGPLLSSSSAHEVQIVSRKKEILLRNLKGDPYALLISELLFGNIELRNYLIAEKRGVVELFHIGLRIVK